MYPIKLQIESHFIHHKSYMDSRGIIPTVPQKIQASNRVMAWLSEVWWYNPSENGKYPSWKARRETENCIL
jgi:hypothetical protein